MVKIRLRLKASKEFQIEARTFPAGGSQPDQRKGNVDTIGGDKIVWEAQPDGDVSLYTVHFFDLRDGSATWPFVELEDGTGAAPDGYVGPLTLKPRDLVTLTTKSIDLPAKYEVSASRTDNRKVDDLDPMIIIRPALLAKDSALFGVTCAVLGAAVGALATWALQ